MLMAVLVFLLLRQIMPIAAGLAGGMALSSFGVVSGGVGCGAGRGGCAGAAVAGGRHRAWAAPHAPAQGYRAAERPARQSWRDADVERS